MGHCSCGLFFGYLFGLGLGQFQPLMVDPTSIKILNLAQKSLFFLSLEYSLVEGEIFYLYDFYFWEVFVIWIHQYIEISFCDHRRND